MLKKLGIVLGLAMLAFLAWVVYQYSMVDARVSAARTFVGEQQWRDARHQLRGAVWWRPNHPEANYLMAEALTRDELLTPPGDVEAGLANVDAALQYLDQVPDDSEFGSQAHVKAGSLEALLKLRPAEGLSRLKRAIELDPDNAEAYYLTWKVHELIGRPHMSVDDVWKAIELCPDQRRPTMLREWYMGEFFATTANVDLEVKMGLLAPGEQPSDQQVAERYLEFIRVEPKSTLGYVALARWFLKNGAPQDCVLQLDEAVKNADNPYDDPLLIATLIQVLENLGKVEEAASFFKKWPGEKDGYDYWRAKGLIEHKVNKDLPAAIEAYRNAIPFWPGAVDWRTWNLLANCLRENGQADEAAKVAERSIEIERLMRADIQTTLRRNLGNLNDPKGLADVVRFYRDLELNREADAWQAIIDSLESVEMGGA